MGKGRFFLVHQRCIPKVIQNLVIVLALPPHRPFSGNASFANLIHQYPSLIDQTITKKPCTWFSDRRRCQNRVGKCNPGGKSVAEQAQPAFTEVRQLLVMQPLGCQLQSAWHRYWASPCSCQRSSFLNCVPWERSYLNQNKRRSYHDKRLDMNNTKMPMHRRNISNTLGKAPRSWTASCSADCANMVLCVTSSSNN
jgi:hypothetical protein